MSLLAILAVVILLDLLRSRWDASGWAGALDAMREAQLREAWQHQRPHP